jgi:NADH-quinone oxidoreductase E subunit
MEQTSISFADVLEDFPPEEGSLIPLLQKAQVENGYLPEEVIDLIADYLGLSASQVYGVATFYAQFKFNPPGRHSIKICLGTACHVLGGEHILNYLKQELNISPGETMEDKRFDLERVACLGCCALAPVLRINNDICSRMSIVKLKEVLNKYE